MLKYMNQLNGQNYESHTARHSSKPKTGQLKTGKPQATHSFASTDFTKPQKLHNKYFSWPTVSPKQYSEKKACLNFKKITSCKEFEMIF